MSTKHFLIIVVTTIATAIAPLKAEVVTDLSLGGGYQDNIFNDSLSMGDSYSSIDASVGIYPSSSLQLSANGSYNSYTSTEGLSNIQGRISLTSIPTNESSPVLLLVSGELSYRKFGDLFELYDQNGFSSAALIGYRIIPKVLIKSKAFYSGTSYFNSDYGSNRGLELVGGLNFTPFGSNSFDLEVSWARKNYDMVSVEVDRSQNGHAPGNNASEDFSSISYLLRYSRPLGLRTGIGLTMSRHMLQYEGTLAVTGYSIDDLSPWGELWDGTGLSLRVKHYFPGQVTMVVNGSIFGKSYLDAIENSTGGENEYWINSREDNNYSFQTSLSKAITIGQGRTLTPSFRFGYSHNSSTNDLYDYSTVSASLSMKIHL